MNNKLNRKEMRTKIDEMSMTSITWMVIAKGATQLRVSAAVYWEYDWGNGGVLELDTCCRKR